MTINPTTGKPRRNHILDLQDKVARQEAVIAAYERGLSDLEFYLSLPKFREDPTVQIQDVFNRIANVRNRVGDVERQDLDVRPALVSERLRRAWAPLFDEFGPGEVQ